MKRIGIFLAALLLALAVAASSPKRELRSVWLTSYLRIDWPSSSAVGNSTKCKQELIDYLDKHRNRNYTGVCLQVRPMADALYQSSYEPWSQYLTNTRGKDPGWDPLAFAVEECHKRGLECYAWVNPFRFNRGNASRTTAQDLAVLAHDGWIIDEAASGSTGEYQVFNPGRADVRQYLYGIVREIYTNYRIDGMLFDDYFYPNGIPATTQAQDYALFKEQNPSFSGTSSQLATAMGNWRRANINLFINELYTMIQADRPDLRFGVGPAGIAKKGCANVDGLEPVSVGSDWQYDDIYSDPVAWLNEGSVDFISPQIYWFSRPGNNSYTSAAPYDKLAEWWSYAAHFFGRHFYSSMAPYRLVDNNNETHWEDLSNQIYLNRTYNADNAPGAIMYSAKYMDGPTLTGWGAYLQANSFQTKSLVPKVTWKSRPALAKPVVAYANNTLSWPTGLAAQTGCDPVRRYTVYAVPASLTRAQAQAADGDGIDARYLLQVVYAEQFEVPEEYRADYWYAVCAYDGYGYESEPAYVNENSTPEPVVTEDDDYAPVGECSLTNLWFRSTQSPFGNIDFEDSGLRNRGMAIGGDRIYLTERAQNAQGPSYLKMYDLNNGYYLGKIELDIPTAEAYPCNDIIRDNNGNLYINSISLNINSASNPVQVYRFDPATKATTHWVALNAPLPSHRVDHLAVEDLNDGTYYIWAAVASKNVLLRWTVQADGTILDTASKTVAAFNPASAANFGIAPHIIALGNDRVIVDGTATAPAEYDFTTGQLVSGIGSEIHPDGYCSNGVAHFTEGDCYLVYAAADYLAPSGYKFNITSAANHQLAAHELLWTVPQANIGTANPTHNSTPVDVVSSPAAEGDGWDAHVAVYAPGSGLAVYKLAGSYSTTVQQPVAREAAYKIVGRRAYFNAKVHTAALYDLSGRRLASAAETTTLALPAAPGLYILHYDGTAKRIILP